MSQTLCGQACPDILTDANRWAEAVEAALRETSETNEHRVDTWRLHGYVITLFLAVQAFPVFWIANLVPMTVQTNVISLAVSFVSLGMACFWTVRGTSHLLSTFFKEGRVTSFGVQAAPPKSEAIPEIMAKREARQALQRDLGDVESELEQGKGKSALPQLPPARVPALPLAGGSPGLPPGPPKLAKR